MRNEIHMFHSSALEEYLRLYNKANKCTCVKYKILLTVKMFRNMLAHVGC